jgi:biopolymer transport protein ExbD
VIRIPEERDDLQLNMAPMIDMVFLLLIFFLTATTFAQREREQDVLLPSNRNPGSLSRAVEESLVVNVLQDGRFKLLGREVGEEELSARVRERRERAGAGGPLKVLVRADRRTPYGNVAQALAAVERGGVPRPYIITRLLDIEE